MKEMKIMRAIGEIDDKYIDEAAPVQKKRALRFSSWTKYTGMAAAAVLVVGAGIFVMTRNNGIGVTDPAQTSASASPNVAATDDAPIVVMSAPVGTGEDEMGTLSNPYTEYDSLEEAEKAVGFELTAPDSIGKFNDKTVTVISGTMIELNYRDSSGNYGVSIRKQKASEDISGDFNIYETEFPVKIGGINVAMSGISGSDGTVSIYKAIWTDGEYAYSITSAYDSFAPENERQPGLSQTEMEEIIKNVK